MSSIVVLRDHGDPAKKYDELARREGMLELGNRVYGKLRDTNVKNRAVVWQTIKELIELGEYTVFLQRRKAGSPDRPWRFPISKVNNRLYRYLDEEQGNREEYLVLEIERDQTNGKLHEQNITVPNQRGSEFNLAYLDDLIDDIDNATSTDEKRKIALGYVMFSRCR